MTEEWTLDAVARFVASPWGLEFAAMCKEWGEVPSRRAGLADDFLAAQFDLSLAKRLWAERDRDPNDDDPHAAMVSKRDELGAKVKAMRGR